MIMSEMYNNINERITARGSGFLIRLEHLLYVNSCDIDINITLTGF